MLIYYDYMPSSETIAMIAAHGLVIVINVLLWLLFKGKKAYTLLLIAGSAVEVLGFVGTLLGGWENGDVTGAIINSVGLMCAPVLLTLAIIYTFIDMMRPLGLRYLAIGPTVYRIIFGLACTAAFAVQGVFTGIITNQNGTISTHRSNAAALVFAMGLQLAIILGFFLLVGLLFSSIQRANIEGTYRPVPREHKDYIKFQTLRQSSLFEAYFMLQVVAMLLIFVRCAYRFEQLARGYLGASSGNLRWMFTGLDVVPMILAEVVSTIASPAFALRETGRTVKLNESFQIMRDDVEIANRGSSASIDGYTETVQVLTEGKRIDTDNEYMVDNEQQRDRSSHNSKPSHGKASTRRPKSEPVFSNGHTRYSGNRPKRKASSMEVKPERKKGKHVTFTDNV